jgi:hypothetical protein
MIRLGSHRRERGSRPATADSAAKAIARAFDLEAVVSSYFPYLLLGVALAALVPIVLVAVARPLFLDGYWNVFRDTQDRWALFFSEYRRDQHPILYRLVLRWVASLGSSRLLYRSASIVPGLATIYVLGLVAARLCRSRAVALLAAARQIAGQPRTSNLEPAEKTIRTLAAGAQLKKSSILTNDAVTFVTFTAE